MKVHLASEILMGHLWKTHCGSTCTVGENGTHSLWAVTCERCRKEVLRISIDALMISEAVVYAKAILQEGSRRKPMEIRNSSCFEIAMSAVSKLPHNITGEAVSAHLKELVIEEARLFRESVRGKTLSLEFDEEGTKLTFLDRGFFGRKARQ
jgi:hypothetical protein